MGDSDEEADAEEVAGSLVYDVEAAKEELTLMQAELDSGFASMSYSGAPLMNVSTSSSIASGSNTHHPISNGPSTSRATSRAQARHSAPSVLKSHGHSSFLKPDYKLLHQTHVRLQHRFLTSAYRLSALQTRGTPTNAHTNTIYCLQLYTYPATGVQVLFTGSRDKTVREWNLTTGLVERVIGDVHASSVLSICVYNGILASAGSDRRVAVWDLEKNKLLKVISDHEDSVLCVRFDEERLVSCSKGRSATLPASLLGLMCILQIGLSELIPFQIWRLSSYSALTAPQSTRCPSPQNTSSLAPEIVLCESGRPKLVNSSERSRTSTPEGKQRLPLHSRIILMTLWIRIASIDFKPPFILSGSSDKHLRLFDITTVQGWSTSPETQYNSANPPATNVPLATSSTGNAALPNGAVGSVVCQACGSANAQPARQQPEARCMHADLVRSVALGDEYALSGSYDLSIKVCNEIRQEFLLLKCCIGVGPENGGVGS